MTAPTYTDTPTAAPTRPSNGHQPDMHWPTLTRVTDTPRPTHVGRHTDTPARRPAAPTHRQGVGRQATVRAVGALALVNGLAVYGQLAYVYDHVAPDTWATPARVALSVAAATAFEAIALFVGWHAHDALLMKAHGTARRLRRWSYLIATLVAAANYSHFAASGMRPTAAAVMFGLVSLLSPWLWGLHTRREQHIQLIQERRADEVGAEFSSVRRRNFPVRSYMAYRWSIDHGVTDPIEAWRGYNAERAAKRAARQVAKATRPTHVGAATDRVRPTHPADTPDTPDMPRTDRSANGRQVAKRTPRKRPPRPKSVKPTDTRPVVADTPVTDTPALAPIDTPTQAATGQATDMSVGHSAAAVANAADLRRRYPEGLPSDYRIRTDMKWSVDRIKPARAAHEAGADLRTDTPTNLN